MTRFWHRRVTEVTLFFALVILALFGYGLLQPDSDVSLLFPISIVSACIAGLSLVAAVILYFKQPKTNLSLGTFIVYALLVITIASTVLMTGESNSPLIGLWIASGVFAGVFGWRGYALILVLVLGYDAYAYLNDWSSITSLAITTTVSIAPLIASFIIWHSKSDKSVAHDKAYSELATELSHESNKYETVINAINDGVVSIDTKGVIQLINPAAQRIIGWGKDDAVGLSYKSVVKLNDKTDKPVTPEEDPVSRVLSTSQEVHSEDFSVTTEAGKKVLLSLIVSPIGTPSSGAIMVFRDMTKEKSEEREQAEFISTASHEMRTPVATMEGYLGLVLNPATATIDDKARDYVQKAQASAQHLGRLFQDLLDVTKADDGRMTNNPKVVDVSDFIGGVIDGLVPKATEKGLRFLYKPTRDESANERTMLPVYYSHVDNDHLREVVSNLIENAIKYTPAGDVIVDVGGDDKHVRISVQDSGIGIPVEDIPHLFQKFYRVDNSDTREIGGTGLGLYLCRRLAELMGGQILVESEYKKGSTFSLEIPRIDHMEAQRLMELAATTEQVGQSTISAETTLTDSFIPSDVPLPPAPAQPIAPSVPPAPIPVQQAASQQAIQPIYQQPSVQQPPQPMARPVTPQPPNVPLSQIEQNPGAYMQGRPAMQIPVRGPSDSNQP